MNRRAFILSLFGGVAAVEFAALPDLATPRSMPPIVPTPLDPAKWQSPYLYAFFAEMRGTEWGLIQTLAIRKDFYLTRITWEAPDGVMAELHSSGSLLCRASLNAISTHSYRLVWPLLMPAGEEFVLKLKNAEGNFGMHKAALLLYGFQLMSDAEIAEMREIGQCDRCAEMEEMGQEEV